MFIVTFNVSEGETTSAINSNSINNLYLLLSLVMLAINQKVQVLETPELNLHKATKHRHRSLSKIPIIKKRYLF